MKNIHLLTTKKFNSRKASVSQGAKCNVFPLDMKKKLIV